jgi:hypothetical protein
MLKINHGEPQALLGRKQGNPPALAPHLSLRMFQPTDLGGQLLQQRLRLLQVPRVKTLRKPAVNRSKQFARLPHLALGTPETREAHGGAEFPRFGLLLA